MLNELKIADDRLLFSSLGLVHDYSLSWTRIDCKAMKIGLLPIIIAASLTRILGMYYFNAKLQ